LNVYENQTHVRCYTTIKNTVCDNRIRGHQGILVEDHLEVSVKLWLMNIITLAC